MVGNRAQNLPTQSPTLGLRYHSDGELFERVIDLEIEKRALLAAWDSRIKHANEITLDMIAEEVDEATAPPLDRTVIDEAALNSDQKFWRDNGYLIKENFIPHDLIDRYCKIRARHPSKFGWDCPVPLHVYRGNAGRKPLSPSHEAHEELDQRGNGCKLDSHRQYGFTLLTSGNVATKAAINSVRDKIAENQRFTHSREYSVRFQTGTCIFLCP